MSNQQIKDLLEEKAQQDAIVNNLDANYIRISFGYNSDYVFPFDQGIALLEQFKIAEKYDRSDYSNPKITPIDHEMEAKILSRDSYINLKMRHLLGVSENQEEETT